MGEQIVKVAQAKAVLITSPLIPSAPPIGAEKEQERSTQGNPDGSKEAGAPEKEVEAMV